MIPLDRGRLLGIDHGTKVIGLAVCDATWIAARPFGLITRRSRESDFARIAAIIAEQRVAAIVLGMPETPPDFKGISQASTVRRWAKRLGSAVRLPVYPWDESLSTFEAESIAAELGQRVRGRIDDRAAAVILQSFIDAHPPGTPLPEPLNQQGD
ncbi:MAG TPA: Holliday junction resolvase RuvX [Aggregatilineales bacterium]|nr:Holliday junction resolvase RuvX [Aggregatilineales bacterium]